MGGWRVWWLYDIWKGWPERAMPVPPAPRFCTTLSPTLLPPGLLLCCAVLQLLSNIFTPLFEVTRDPNSHPQLHLFLKGVSPRC